MLHERRTVHAVDPAERARMSDGLERVHVVFKTHLDLGYTDLAVNVLRRYREVYIPGAIRLAREMLEQTGQREFIWTTGSWLIAHALKDGSPSLRADLDAAIRDGLVAWHAIPFSTQSEMMSRRTFEHGIEVSKRLDETYGRQTIAGKMTDVPGHTIGLVAPMAAAGIRYFHVGVNPASPVPVVPDHFRWVAPDGSEVVVSYDPEYGSDPDTATIRRVPGSGEALFLAFTNDNLGPPTRESVEHQLGVLREMYPEATVEASTLDAFGRAAWAAREHLPTVTQEIGDSWIYGAASDPILTSRFTRLQRLREAWLDSGRLIEHSDEDFEFADELALIAEHTWGYDVKRYLPDNSIYVKEDFQAARDRDVVDADAAIPPTLSYTKQWADWAADGPSGFAATQASFDEKRAHSDAALAALPAELRAEAQAAITQTPPRTPDTATPVTGRIMHENIEVELDSHGALVSLAIDGIDVLDAPRSEGHQRQGKLGDYRYIAYGAGDEQRFIREYVRDTERNAPWAFPDLGKPGLELVRPGRVTETFRPTTHGTVRWVESDGTLAVRFTGGMPTQATDMFGAPRRVTIDYRVSAADRLLVDVIAYLEDKDAFYGPEASWLTIRPPVATPSRWRFRKSDAEVNPLDVVRDGGRVLHYVQSLRYQDALTDISIVPLDIGLVSPGGPRMFSHDNRFGDLADGFAFCLHNNAWGTNFRQWFEEDQRAAFTLDFGATRKPASA